LPLPPLQPPPLPLPPLLLPPPDRGKCGGAVVTDATVAAGEATRVGMDAHGEPEPGGTWLGLGLGLVLGLVLGLGQGFGF